MTSLAPWSCVHAHPDDEALFTAGITSHYAERGLASSCVTCTNGQLGSTTAGRAGADPRPRRAGDARDARGRAAARARPGRLRRACVTLGYRRLGHDGLGAATPTRDAFVNADVERRRAHARRAHRRGGRIGRRHLRRERLLRSPRPRHGQRRDARAPWSSRVEPERLYYPVVPRAGPRRVRRRGARRRASSCRRGSLDAGATCPTTSVATTMDVARLRRRASRRPSPRTRPRSTTPTSSRWTTNSSRCSSAPSTTSAPGAVDAHSGRRD